MNKEKAIGNNNELKLKLMSNKEQNVMEDNDKVQDTHVVRNPINKKKIGHLCVTSSQRFSTTNGLEKHIQDKHTQLALVRLLCLNV